MDLHSLQEKAPDSDLRREKIRFAAANVMEAIDTFEPVSGYCPFSNTKATFSRLA